MNKKPVKQIVNCLTGFSPSLYFNYSAAASSTLSADSAGASTNSVIPLFTKILYHEISFSDFQGIVFPEGYFSAETFRDVYLSAGMSAGRVFAE